MNPTEMDASLYSPRQVFWTACAGMLLFGICMITLGSLSIPVGRRFSLGHAEIGALFSVMPFGVLTGSLVFGPVCDRHGYRIPLVVSCLLLCIGFQGIAYASGTAQLAVFIFLCGLGGGIVNGATNGVVADISTTDKGGDLSLLGVFFAVGAVGMPSLLALFSRTHDYDAVLSIVGLLPLPVALACLGVRFPAPKVLPSVPMRETFRLATSPLLLSMSFFLFLQSGIEATVSNWTTRYLAAWKGLDRSSALHALSLMVVGMAVARILIGRVLRGWTRPRILFSSFPLTILAMLLLATGRGELAAFAALFLTGYSIAAAFPLMMGMIGDQFPKMSASAFSIALVIALSGNMAVNYAMGMVAERLGISLLPVVVICLTSLMAVTAALIFRKPAHNTKK
ncbi:MAG: MFS transporter [Chitinophagia bacterium]|nr:MFS transporter [Chitinophagia bacterium]